MAIDVGKVFDTEKTIITYENLGIGRLIYQLPTVMCEMFLQEVFKKNPIDAWIRRPSSPSTSSLKTTSTFPRRPESSSSTGTPWFTAWRRSRSSPAWTCGSLTMPSPSKWPSWSKSTWCPEGSNPKAENHPVVLLRSGRKGRVAGGIQFQWESRSPGHV